tara:strand:- start:163 stop:264 length:102 start_codon:yes stop_codon:yes gene_type:complete
MHTDKAFIRLIKSSKFGYYLNVKYNIGDISRGV